MGSNRTMLAQYEDTAVGVLADNLDEQRQVINQLMDSASLVHRIREMVECSEPVSETTVRLVDLELARTQHRAGLSIGLLSTDGTTTSVDAKGLRERAKEIWQAIMEALRKSLASFQSFFQRVTQQATDNLEKTEEVISEIREQSQDTWALPAPAPQYPYNLTNAQLSVLSIDGIVPQNWATVIPQTVKQLGDWLESMVTAIERQQTAMVDTYQPAFDKSTPDWSPLEKLVDEYLRDYHARFKAAPNLLGRTKLTWVSDLTNESDVVEKLDTLRHCFKLEQDSTPVENRLRATDHEELIRALTASLNWPQLKTAGDNRMMSDQVDKLARIFDHDRAITSWSPSEMEKAQKIARLIPGNLYMCLMPVMRYYTSTTTTFVRTIQHIQKYHLK